ncbi:MAG: alpha/beta hydrolase [Clostridia bacterium]|nr:alpha/beta hydrolase [Clostridia bacterium]
MLKIQSFILAAIMTVASFFGSVRMALDPTIKKPSGYLEMNDISYGESAQQVFDISFPEGIGKELSIAIYIHGGAWWGGDKNDAYSILQGYFSERKMLDDMICAKINYRLLNPQDPEISLETQLQDIDSAIKKIVEVCAQQGYSITKAMIWGVSAGGHLSTMYCYRFKDTSAVDIGLCYSICGPTDLTNKWYLTECEIGRNDMLLLQSLLSGTEINEDNINSDKTLSQQEKISPITYVTPETVPTLYFSCGKDILVPVADGEKLAKTLKANGVDHYYMEFPNSGHCSRDKDDYGYYTLFDFHLDAMLKKYVKSKRSGVIC